MSVPVWPELPLANWIETRDTLTLWLQVVGKVRIARSPLLNHWWNAPLYLTARGLTTSLIPDRPGRSFAVDIDLLNHRLEITTTTAESRSIALEPRSVRDFYADFMARLDEST